MRARAARHEAAARAEAAAAEVTRVGFAPIVRVDAQRREIELCATSEALDSYGTVFGYEASRDAFARWAGNVREMHERKAVGRRVAVRCDDAQRKVYVRLRISQGAEDTWQKVLDGTLAGASIGAANVEWRARRVGGQEVPVAQRYDLVELSLVDLPANPDAQGVTFVRDGVPLPDLLDELEELDQPDHLEAASEAGAVATSPGWVAPTLWGDLLDEMDAPGAGAPVVAQPAAQPTTHDAEPIERRIAQTALAAGHAELARAAQAHEHGRGYKPAAASEETAGADAESVTRAAPARAARLAALGAPSYVERAPGAPVPSTRTEPDEGARSYHAAGHAATAETPNGWPEDVAPRAERARGPFSDNPDGPAWAGVPARWPERPTATTYAQTADGNQQDVFHVAARGILQGCGCPACLAALAALAGGDGMASASEGDAGGRAAQVTRALEAHTRRLDAAVRAVHTGVSQVAATLGQIERRVAAIEAQPMPGGPHLRVAEKTYALLPQGGRADASEQMRALEALAGRLNDPQAQIAVATEMIRLQQEAAGLPAAMQAMPRAGAQERGGWHGR